MASNMLNKDLINTLQDVFGRFPNVRPSHAKGIFLKGTFVPTDEAKQLSIAPHFNKPSTQIIARFSLFTGIPDLASTDPRANPNGFAVRFVLGGAPGFLGTDIVSHASPLFVGSTGDEVLGFFKALRDNTVHEFVKSHPAAAAFVREGRPIPRNFGTQSFYSINAFKLVNADGDGIFVRYRWIPVVDCEYLTPAELEKKGPNFLFDELPGVLEQGPIGFKLVVQIAGDGDIVDNCTNIWPEDRKLMELGTLKLDSLMTQDELPPKDKLIVFSPIPRVDGIEPSADPILAARSGVYSMSGKSRRTAHD